MHGIFNDKVNVIVNGIIFLLPLFLATEIIRSNNNNYKNKLKKVLQLRYEYKHKYVTVKNTN